MSRFQTTSLLVVMFLLTLSCAGSAVAACADPPWGEVTDEWLTVAFEIAQCCCYSNAIGGSNTWVDEGSAGPQGSCSCPGWASSNCKKKKLFTTFDVTATVQEEFQNYKVNGVWASIPAPLEYYVWHCYCSNSSTHEREDCDMLSSQVVTQTTNLYSCRGC
jgi:hypothetical protein